MVLEGSAGYSLARGVHVTRRRGKTREDPDAIAIHVNIELRSMDYINMMTFRYALFFTHTLSKN